MKSTAYNHTNIIHRSSPERQKSTPKWERLRPDSDRGTTEKQSTVVKKSDLNKKNKYYTFILTKISEMHLSNEYVSAVKDVTRLNIAYSFKKLIFYYKTQHALSRK